MKTLNDYINQNKDALENWWENGDQKYPGIITSCLKDNHDPLPDTDDLEKYWLDIDFVMKRHMAKIDNTNYYGWAVPFQLIDFASSAMACALGARPELLNKDTIWAHPAKHSLEEVAEVSLSEENTIYRHILSLARASVEKAPNHHMIAHFPLEGPLDIISDIYGAENLLMDLLTQPEAVKKAAERAKQMWMQGFETINKMVAKTGNPGGMGWAGIWAPGTTFPIQEDFSYMISPDQFKDYSLPHIIEMVEAMDYGFYHLDGIGSLPHLDMLLQIEKLKAIQWQPGAGKEKINQWYDVLKKILAAGKSVQVFARPEEIDDLINNVGAKGLLIICPGLSNEEALKVTEKYSN